MDAIQIAKQIYRIMIIYSSESFNKLIMILTIKKLGVGTWSKYLPIYSSAVQVLVLLLESKAGDDQFNYVFDRCNR